MDLKYFIKNNLTKLEPKKLNGLEIYKLAMHASNKDCNAKLQKYTLGCPNNPYKTKIILLMGETGTGKTTLINAMTNYIFGVKFEDNFRFKLVDDTDDIAIRNEALSQTKFINCYRFNHRKGMPFEYNYVIIDTPGFGDTRGVAKDKELMKQLEQCFTNKDYGITHLDALGIVAKTNSCRLTHFQKYIYRGLTGMFGINIKNNVFIMGTFYDGTDTKVETALGEAGVSYSQLFCFNNGALYSSNTANVKFCKQLWEITNDGMDEFFTQFPNYEGVSLNLTMEVMQTKREIETILAGMRGKIKEGMAVVTIVTNERNVLAKANNELQELKQSEKKWSDEEAYYKNLQYLYLIPFAGLYTGIAMTVKYKEASNELDKCRKHISSTTTSRDEKQKTIADLDNKIATHTGSVIQSIKEANLHDKQLNKICLKPGNISTIEYIKYLIDVEQQTKEQGYCSRIDKLTNMLKNYELLKEILSDKIQRATGQNNADYLKELDTKLFEG